MNSSILHWNAVAIEASRLDYASATPETPPNPEQPGPTATSRALAIVHLAMHDAYVGIAAAGNPTYLPYAPTERPAANPAAAPVAVATAACITLTAMYGRQEASFLRAHADHLAMLGVADPAVSEGLGWGTLVAERMLKARKDDGSATGNGAYAPSTEPGRHRLDPMAPRQGFLGAHWGSVRPFAVEGLTSSGGITFTPPPQMTDPLYTEHYTEVRAYGALRSAVRSADQTTVGIFWGYDGARNIGVPPRLYNQVVRAMAEAAAAVPGTLPAGDAQYAVLFAAVNAGMADAGIAAWRSKYMYNIWRPVVGVREADAGWGPSGRGDGNARTEGDPYWVPLGAPQTNVPPREGITPGFPAYPSGHATFGTAAVRIAQKILNLRDDFSFTFVSDELNGESTGAQGVRMRHQRPLTPAKAITENLESRVWLGVHWRFDGEEGARIGEQIASAIAGHLPLRAP